MKKTALFVAMLAAGSAQALQIDAFDGTGAFDLNAPQTNTAVGTSSSGITRTLDSTTSGTDTNVQIDTATNPGVYAHSQDSGVNGYSELSYSLGGVDLTEGGTQNAFRVDLISVDLNGVIGITVDGVTQSLSTTDIILGAGVLPAVTDFLFATFGGVDFSNVSSVSLFIDGNNVVALDATIDNIGTACSGRTNNGGSADAINGTCGSTPIPVPAPLALLGLGLAGLGLMRGRIAA